MITLNYLGKILIYSLLHQVIIVYKLRMLSFNETVGMDLNQWSSNTPVCFLPLVDHATRYSSSCVIYIKKKEETVRKLFQQWITIFRVSNKYLVDNGGEFANTEFITCCKNMNIQICTTIAKSPWSNGLVKRHNAVLGMTVSKVIKDVNCQLEVAVAWSLSAKNCLKNVYGFSPNQLVFGRNPVTLIILIINYQH